MAWILFVITRQPKLIQRAFSWNGDENVACVICMCSLGRFPSWTFGENVGIRRPKIYKASLPMLFHVVVPIVLQTRTFHLFHRRGTWSSEKLSISPKITQEGNGKADTESQTAWLQWLSSVHHSIVQSRMRRFLLDWLLRGSCAYRATIFPLCLRVAVELSGEVNGNKVYHREI